MDPVVGVGILAVWAATVAAGTARAAAVARGESLRSAAESAGLTQVVIRKSLGVVSRLSGRAGAHSVRLEKYRRGRYERGTRIVVSGLRHGAGELSFRRENLGSALNKVIARREIELGDPGFDDLVYLQGSNDLACALFDEETRWAVIRLLKGFYHAPGARGVELGDGTRTSLADDELSLELRERGWSIPDAQRPSVALPALLGIAARLVRPDDIAVRLAENLRRDPIEAVRLANLHVLLERHHKHPAAREALARAAGEDSSEEVRLRAALALGTRGWDALLRIASSETSDDERAARAIAGLGDHLSREQAEGILAHALRVRRAATARACLESLGRRGGPEVIDLLTRVLVVERGTWAAAAAHALGATGEPAAEAPLIEALRHDSPAVLMAVARELGRMGTAAAVMPLRATSDQRDADFRRAARQAIAEIQGRLQGAAPGQLSLAGSEAGQVSLAEDDGVHGRLALSDRDDEIK